MSSIPSPSILRIIDEVAKKRALQLGSQIYRITEFDDLPIDSRKPIAWGVDLTGLTIVLLCPENPSRFENSHLLAFDPKTGRLIYDGSANDEG
jgi:hypothetical protein